MIGREVVAALGLALFAALLVAVAMVLTSCTNGPTQRESIILTGITPLPGTPTITPQPSGTPLPSATPGGPSISCIDDPGAPYPQQCVSAPCPYDPTARAVTWSTELVIYPAPCFHCKADRYPSMGFCVTGYGDCREVWTENAAGAPNCVLTCPGGASVFIAEHQRPTCA